MLPTVSSEDKTVKNPSIDLDGSTDVGRGGVGQDLILSLSPPSSLIGIQPKSSLPAQKPTKGERSNLISLPPQPLPSVAASQPERKPNLAKGGGKTPDTELVIIKVERNNEDTFITTRGPPRD